MIIYNAKIYTMNDSDEIIENGYVKYENGKITSIGEGLPVNADGKLIVGFLSSF